MDRIQQSLYLFICQRRFFTLWNAAALCRKVYRWVLVDDAVFFRRLENGFV